jgi:hypothetical protein
MLLEDRRVSISSHCVAVTTLLVTP